MFCFKSDFFIFMIFLIQCVWGGHLILVSCNFKEFILI